jgi:hypothetical protein
MAINKENQEILCEKCGKRQRVAMSSPVVNHTTGEVYPGGAHSTPSGWVEVYQEDNQGRTVGVDLCPNCKEQ